MISVILLDVMGVVFVVGDDTRELLVPYVQALRPGTSLEFILTQYREATLGRLTAEGLWGAFGFHQGEFEATQREYLDRYVIDPSFTESAKVLRKRYRLALLSNDVPVWSDHLRRKFGIDDLIERAFISGRLGFRKPDPRIYQEAIKGVGVPAGQCLFVDDDPERVEAAVSQGMTGVLFNRQGSVFNGLQVRSFEQLRALLL